MIARVVSTFFLVALVGVGAGGCTGDDADGETGADTDAATESADESGGESFACGELECAAEQACLNSFEPPMCENKLDDEPCPAGTTESLCGGAGIPCCCGPTPATVYACVATTACGEVVDCSCLAEVCVPSCTATADPRVFHCEEPPAP